MPTTVINKLNVKDKGVDTLLELGAEGQNVEIGIFKSDSEEQPLITDATIYKNIIRGYYNQTNDTFYEDATHTVSITGDNDTIYIDITLDQQSSQPKNDYYLYDSPSEEYEIIESPEEVSILPISEVLEAIRYKANTPDNNKMNKDGSNSTNHVKFNGSFTIGGRESGSAIGSISVAEGVDVIASGDGSHAEGDGTQASGFCSHSEGARTIASGLYSHAEGSNTTANGYGSHAEGHNTVASGQYSYARGDGYAADTSYPGEIVASGNGSSAYGIAEGSDSEGQVGQIKATGHGSLAHGLAWETGKIIASGLASHAEGINTTASGQGSHAEGDGTVASGDGSHAEGNITQANGDYSHAEGYGTQANGDYSFAGGFKAIANGKNSFVFGGNIENSETCDYVFGFNMEGIIYNENKTNRQSKNGTSGVINRTDITVKLQLATYGLYLLLYHGGSSSMSGIYFIAGSQSNNASAYYYSLIGNSHDQLIVNSVSGENQISLNANVAPIRFTLIRML